MGKDVQNYIQALQSMQYVLREKYHVKRIGIFGSVARGEHSDASDIDVLVEFSEPVGMFDFLRLERFLSGALGRRVDLVTRNALKPSIKADVLNQAIYA